MISKGKGGAGGEGEGGGGGRERRRASRSPRPAPEPLRSLLVAVDLTSTADRVLGRVARLPLARGAQVTLLHVVPDSLSRRDQRRAARDAAKALADEARALRESAPLRIEPVVEVGPAARQIADCATARKAELIVMGRGHGRGLRDALLGSTAERVIRLGRHPVLVVRRPARAPYERPALALDLDRAAHPVIALVLRIVRPPRPPVAVIHAFEDLDRKGIYPSFFEDLEARKEKLRISATRSLGLLLADAVARAGVPADEAPTWTLHVRYGSPQVVIAKAVERMATDLLALGTHAHAGLAHLLLGTVAGDVLRAVGCDVLVVPPRTARR